MSVHRLSRAVLPSIAMAVGLVLLPGALISTSQAAAPSAQVLPADTIGYVTIHDVPRFKEAWGQTQIGRLLSDPAMQPFLDDIKAQLDESFAGMQEEIGLTASELWDLPQGQLTVALVPSGESAIAAVALVELGDNEPDAERLLARAAESLEEQGAARQEEDFQGVRLIIYELPAAEAADAPGQAQAAPNKVAYCIHEQTLAVASDVDVLKGILARWGGDAADVLATQPAFSRIAQRIAPADPKPPLEGFLDPVALLSRMFGAGGNQQAQMAANLMPLLGLDKLKGVGGSMELVVGPYDTLTRIQASIEEPRQGLLKLLQFPRSNLQPEPWVPSDVSSYFTLNWDLDAAWRALAELYDQMSGPGAFEQTLQIFTNDPNGPRIDIQRDVIDPVSGRVTVLTDYVEPITVNSQRMLVGVSLDDAQTMTATLDKLMQRAGGGARKREFQGHVIYDVDAPVVPGQVDEDDPEAPAVQMAVAVAQDYFYFASNVTLLEKVLRGGLEPLAQSLDYRLVAGRLPEMASGITFSRPEQAWRSLYESIRSGEIRDSLTGMALFMPALANLAQAIDGEKLPEFDVVRRYLAPSGGYIESDENGVLMVNFALRKESP